MSSAGGGRPAIARRCLRDRRHAADQQRTGQHAIANIVCRHALTAPGALRASPRAAAEGAERPGLFAWPGYGPSMPLPGRSHAPMAPSH